MKSKSNAALNPKTMTKNDKGKYGIQLYTKRREKRGCGICAD
jgi:hypothetical protein